VKKNLKKTFLLPSWLRRHLWLAATVPESGKFGGVIQNPPEKMNIVTTRFSLDLFY
jgi:hypothetical protein